MPLPPRVHGKHVRCMEREASEAGAPALTRGVPPKPLDPQSRGNLTRAGKPGKHPPGTHPFGTHSLQVWLRSALERHLARSLDASHTVIAANELHRLAERRAHHVAAHGDAHCLEHHALLEVKRVGQGLQGTVD